MNKKTNIFLVILTRRAFVVENQTTNTSTPTIETFTVKRRYLTEREVEQLMDTARKLSRMAIAMQR